MTATSDDKGEAEPRDSLVTRKSIALSLAPPRAPPYDSAHRMLLMGQDPTESAALSHETHHHRDGHNHHHHIHHKRHNIMHLIERYHLNAIARLPHPHLSRGPELGDQITRALGVILPMSTHNHLRDSGWFRSIVDGLVTASVPTMALTDPGAVLRFVELTKKCNRIKYGPHPMHVMDMFFPEGTGGPRGLVFFVHGGAWGSGKPWMYRLVASTFLNINLAVAVVGYRTYPDADVNGQVDDLENAAAELARRYPKLCALGGGGKDRHHRPGHIGTCVMGHSSGAHIAFLMVVERARQKIERALALAAAADNAGTPAAVQQPPPPLIMMEVDLLVGLSGPYDISHHFDYEAARGVEELSPMKAATGYSREAMKSNSPAVKLRRLLTKFSECGDDHTMLVSLGNVLPHRMLLLHGIEDDTVPFTATSEAAHIIRSCGITKCDEIYLAETAHQDCAIQLMLGGKVNDNVVRWLDNISRETSSQQSETSSSSSIELQINSRL